MLKKLAMFALLLALGACSSAEPARKPTPAPAQAARPAPTPAPAWTEGAVPEQRAFYGVGSAPLGSQSQEAALEKARAEATEGLKAELQILAGLLKHDHSEQVAEIITRYPTDDFNQHVDAALDQLLQEAEALEVYQQQDPPRVYLLLRVSPEALGQKLQAREGLPEEQKARLNDYGNVFVDNAMTNLGR